MKPSERIKNIVERNIGCELTQLEYREYLNNFEKALLDYLDEQALNNNNRAMTEMVSNLRKAKELSSLDWDSKPKNAGTINNLVDSQNKIIDILKEQLNK